MGVGSGWAVGCRNSGCGHGLGVFRAGQEVKFDSAAVVRGLVGVRANGPGGGEGLALGEWEKKFGG